MGCAASVTAPASGAPLRRTAPGWASDESANAAAPNGWRSAAAPGLQSKETPPTAAADGRSSDAVADATAASTDASRVGAEAIGPLKSCVLTGDLYQRQAAKRTRRQKLHRRRLDRIVAAERYSESMLVQSDRLSLRSLSSRAALSTRMCTPVTPAGSSGASGDSCYVGVAHTPECDRPVPGVRKEGSALMYRVNSSKPAINQTSDVDPESNDIGEGRTTLSCPEDSAACISSATAGGDRATRPPPTDDDNDVSTLPNEAAGQFCLRVPEPSEETAEDRPLPTLLLEQLKWSPPPSATPLQQRLATEQAAGGDCPKLAVCDALAPPHELQPLRTER